MKSRVSTLYKKGVPIPQPKVSALVEGDLNLSVSKHPVTGRCCIVAMVLTKEGLSLVPDLYDAQCVIIAADGMLLRGIEFNGNKQQSQEWWCKPLI
jgi:hypothetical protein